MKSQMMNDVLTGEVVIINGWEDLYDYTSQGFTIYDPLKKIVLGKQVNYLADIGATQEGIDRAFADTLTVFDHIFSQHGLTLVSTDREMKNGTIVLRQDATCVSNKKCSTYEIYKVYVNGQIRGARVTEHFYKKSKTIVKGVVNHYRMTSPKPVMIANDPYSSLCQTYLGAVYEVVQKYIKKKAKLAV